MYYTKVPRSKGVHSILQDLKQSRVRLLDELNKLANLALNYMAEGMRGETIKYRITKAMYHARQPMTAKAIIEKIWQDESLFFNPDQKDQEAVRRCLKAHSGKNGLFIKQETGEQIVYTLNKKHSGAELIVIKRKIPADLANLSD
jgi:hypothetical protein